ncbi:P-loop NTPase [Candidatus Peregrinibacteria bacterium]|nr:P-loop NTPase [Candidatus Peregrinibacteria bacterium]
MLLKVLLALDPDYVENCFMKNIGPENKLSELIKDNSILQNSLNEIGISNFELTIKEAAHVFRVPLPILLKKISKQIKSNISSPKTATFKKGKPVGIKKIIAFHSGKGGVGKTFVSSNFAAFCNEKKLKVGLLDLDIDCPNIFQSFKINHTHIANEEKKILPYNLNGLKILSMAGIQDSVDTPIMWRGPVMTKAIEQLLHDADWGELDFLIIDLPPGTSDIPMTVMHMVVPDGVFLIGAPSDSAVTDTNKSLNMCTQFGIPILGIIENMTGEIFGKAKLNYHENFIAEVGLNASFNQDKAFAYKKDDDLASALEEALKRSLVI